MLKLIHRYINKNTFYISVILTGITSFILGLFYTFFKDSIFQLAEETYLEGTGVLSSYITVSTSMPSGVNYFAIVLVISLLFFFIVSLILSHYLHQKYLDVFNLLSILNIILIAGLIVSCILVNININLIYFLLIVIFAIYLIAFYQCLKQIFNLNFQKRLISLIIFVLPIIIILILLKLFV